MTGKQTIEEKVEEVAKSIPKNAKVWFRKVKDQTTDFKTSVGTFKVLSDLPFDVARTITAEFFNTTYMSKSNEMNAKVISNLLDEIVVNVVLEPRITKSDLKMRGCPLELLSLGMIHFKDIMQSLRYLVGADQQNKEGEETDEDDEDDEGIIDE